MGTKNNPGETQIRWGSTSKPAFGGISFYIVFLLSFAVYAIVFASKDIPIEFFGVLIASSIGFLIGLADDAYNTKPFLKFSGQFACAFVLIATNNYIQLFEYNLINYILNFINEKALVTGASYFQVKQTTDFNIKRLEVLDKSIKGTLLRNNLARAIALEEILNFENHSQHERFLQYYATVNSSPVYLAEVLDLHTDISRMEAAKPLPEIQLQNAERDTISSSKLAQGKSTVLYFWSQTQMNHYRNTLERMSVYRKKFPEVRFVGICIQPFNNMVDEVQKILELDPVDQFALVNFENASKAWVLTLLNKAIIIDPKGRLIEGFGNFSDSNFESLLKGL